MDEKCYVEPIYKTTSMDQIQKAETATLAVWGMGCENCVTRVRNSLLALEGVYGVDVFLNMALAEVRYDNKKVSADALTNAVTSAAKCNACHADLGFHGGSARKGPEYCAMCHNSKNVNDERTSRFEIEPGASTAWTFTPNTVQLSVMVHKIHKAGDLANTYTLGSDRSLTTDPLADSVTFAGAFPGDLKDCMTCHVSHGSNATMDGTVSASFPYPNATTSASMLSGVSADP